MKQIIQNLNSDNFNPKLLLDAYRKGFLDAILEKNETKFNICWNLFWNVVEGNGFNPKFLFFWRDNNNNDTFLTLAISHNQQFKLNEVISTILKKFNALVQGYLKEQDNFKDWINLTTTEGLSALDLALDPVNTRTVKELIAAGANPESLKNAITEADDAVLIDIANKVFCQNEDKEQSKKENMENEEEDDDDYNENNQLAEAVWLSTKLQEREQESNEHKDHKIQLSTSHVNSAQSPINNTNNEDEDEQLQKAIAMSLQENTGNMEDDERTTTAKPIALSQTGGVRLFPPNSNSSSSSSSGSLYSSSSDSSLSSS